MAPLPVTLGVPPETTRSSWSLIKIVAGLIPRLRRSALGPGAGSEVVARARAEARLGRGAGRVGRGRRRPVRLAVAALRRAGTAGPDPSRLAPAGAGALGLRGLLIPDLVAAHPPARPLLAPPAAGPGRAGGLGGRLDPWPGLVGPARPAPGAGDRDEPGVLLHGAGRLQRVDRRPAHPARRGSQEAQSPPGPARRLAASRGEGPARRPGGGLPSRAPGRLQHSLR